jgi:hypothetical protein
MSIAYRLLAVNPEGETPLGRPKPRWVEDIKMNVVEVGLGGVDLIGLGQGEESW